MQPLKPEEDNPCLPDCFTNHDATYLKYQTFISYDNDRIY